MMIQKTLSIVIVNFNGGDLVIECISSIYQNAPSFSFEIIVMDNASFDGSPDRIETLFPELRLFRLGNNMGLTKAFNKGVKASCGHFILSLDPDTVVFPGTIEDMLEFLKSNPEVGACGSKLLNPDGSSQRTARRFPTPMNAIFGRHSLLTRLFPTNRFSKRYLISEKEDFEKPYPVDSLSTACMMLRREIVEQVGVFDEGFFVYWSDTDWCYRMKSAGWQIFSLPGSKVIHKENIKVRHRKWRGANMIIDFHKGAHRLYRKHYVRNAWHPMNLVAIGGLALRAISLIIGEHLRSIWRRII